MGRTKGGLNTKLHIAVDAHGFPVRLIVTDGRAADCKLVRSPIEGLPASCLMADKAYDTNALLAYCQTKGILPVILPSRRRRHLRGYDKDLYRLRYLVENAFLKLKAWRDIANRYAKTKASFFAECQIAAMMIWIR